MQRAILVLSLSLASATLFPSLVTAQNASRDPTAVAEAITQQIFRRIAQTRNAVLLDAPVEEGAALGRLYFYESPSCALHLSNVVNKGTPISLTSARDSPSIEAFVQANARSLRERELSGQYQVSREMAAQLAAAVKDAGAVEGSAEARLLTEALSRVNIRFRVIRTEIPFLAMEREIKKEGIPRISEAPQNYQGIIVPITHFSVSDFSYDSSRVASAEAGLKMQAGFLQKVLDTLSAGFSAQQATEHRTEMNIPTSAIFAFKPWVLDYRSATCPRGQRR